MLATIAGRRRAVQQAADGLAVQPEERGDATEAVPLCVQIMHLSPARLTRRPLRCFPLLRRTQGTGGQRLLLGSRWRRRGKTLACWRSCSRFVSLRGDGRFGRRELGCRCLVRCG
jgi:hypothetical protein